MCAYENKNVGKILHQSGNLCYLQEAKTILCAVTDNLVYIFYSEIICFKETKPGRLVVKHGPLLWLPGEE